jgi:hypothetical protein
VSCHQINMPKREASNPGDRSGLATRRMRTGKQFSREHLSEISPRGCEASAKVRGKIADQRSADLLPIIEDIRAEGPNSLHKIAAALNTRKLKAPRGGLWSAAQVQRVLDRT